MDKIVFIVPYYGKLPVFFREWVYTAGFLKEQNIDFLLLTDLKAEFDFPENVKSVRMSFDEFKERVQSYFDFSISLDSPYKLCDYRPTYGLAFNDLIKEYVFWGHCDVDLIWGNVRKFITDDILSKYDKIQYLGHFVLYRNCERMNNLFRMDGAIYDYRRVLSTSEYYSFDEHPGIMQIVMKHRISNYISINQADISPRYTRLIISRLQNYQHQILYWYNGAVFRKYIDASGNAQCDEFMYAHFQRKHPQGLDKWDENEHPEAFMYKAGQFSYINPDEINSDYILNNDDFVSEMVDKKESRKYRLDKIRHFITCSFKEKIIWLKIRCATDEVNRKLI